MELKCEQVGMEDEREEGELTDEDLEDVSDSSISIGSLLCQSTYMCRSPFKELSLTSVSDDSSDNVSVVEVPVRKQLPIDSYQKYKKDDHEESSRNFKRKRKYSRNRITYQKYSNVSSSSSDEYSPDKKVLRQLREAVRISSTKKNPNCSLRTRIKRMIEPDSPNSKHTVSDDELENLRDQALRSKSNQVVHSEETPENEEETKVDEDLINLRLIALQSAVLKKHENRIKKKKLQEVESCEPKTDNNNIEINSLEPVIESVENQEVPETVMEVAETIVTEVEPITVPEEKIVEPDKPKPVDEDEDILRAMLLTSISRKIANKVTSKQPVPTVIKPPTEPTKPISKSNPLKPTIPIQRFVINVNSDSESDSSPKKSSPFEQNLSKFLKEARKKSEVQQQSDIAKHLPKSQQIEYRHLKRKLQQLSKLKLHQKVKPTNENIISNGLPKKNIRQLNNVNKAVVGKKQIDKVNRLSKKGKYEQLNPLMLKISQARAARDTAQSEVKKLINELRDARIRLTSTHQTYTVLIQQLVQAKEQLDQRTNILPSSENKPKVQSPPPSVTKMCTSTPCKPLADSSLCEISCIAQESNTTADKVSETVVKAQECVVDEKTDDKSTEKVERIEENKQEETKVTEEENKVNSEENKDEVKKYEDAERLGKYKSPLEHMRNPSDYVGNPFLVLCPYDLLGVCKDPDCTYRHCGGEGTGDTTPPP